MPSGSPLGVCMHKKRASPSQASIRHPLGSSTSTVDRSFQSIEVRLDLRVGRDRELVPFGVLPGAPVGVGERGADHDAPACVEGDVEHHELGRRPLGVAEREAVSVARDPADGDLAEGVGLQLVVAATREAAILFDDAVQVRGIVLDGRP